MEGSIGVSGSSALQTRGAQSARDVEAIAESTRPSCVEAALGVDGDSDASALDSFLFQCAAAPAIPEKALSLAAGDVLADHLQLVREIGAGGMGRVYAAKDLQLKRPVAVKVMRISPCGAQTAQITLERFERESRFNARFTHPNIVTLFSAGIWQGVHFLVFELLRGCPLSDHARRDTLSASRIAALLAQATEGLAHAHARRVVHGDIKPANIFVKDDGQAKILDFGLARQFPQSSASSTQKQSGWYGGTAAYLAPEQWRGQLPTVQTDLWALGVTLFELLAGRLPYGRDEGFSQSSEQPSLVDGVGREVPRAFGRLLSSLLARSPSDRCASARQVADQLWQLSELCGRENRARLAKSLSRQHRGQKHLEHGSVAAPALRAGDFES